MESFVRQFGLHNRRRVSLPGPPAAHLPVLLRARPEARRSVHHRGHRAELLVPGRILRLLPQLRQGPSQVRHHGLQEGRGCGQQRVRQSQGKGSCRDWLSSVLTRCGKAPFESGLGVAVDKWISSVTFGQNCIIVTKMDEEEFKFAHRPYRSARMFILLTSV